MGLTGTLMNNQTEDFVYTNESEILNDASDCCLFIRKDNFGSGSVPVNQSNPSQSVSDSQLIKKHFISNLGCKSFDYIESDSSKIIQFDGEGRDAQGIAINCTKEDEKSNLENTFLINNGCEECTLRDGGSDNSEKSTISNPITEIPFSVDNDETVISDKYLLSKNDVNFQVLSNSLSECTDSKSNVVRIEDGSNYSFESFSNNADFQYMKEDFDKSTDFVRCYYFSSDKTVTEQFNAACHNEMGLNKDALVNWSEAGSSISLYSSDSGSSAFESALSSIDVTSPYVTPRNVKPKNNSFSSSKKFGINYAVTSENIPVAISKKSIHASEHNDRSDEINKYDSINDKISSRHNKTPDSKSIRKLLDLTCGKKLLMDKISYNRAKVNQETPIDASIDPKQISLRNKNNSHKINNIKEFYSNRRNLVKRMGSKKFVNSNPDQLATSTSALQHINSCSSKKGFSDKNMFSDKRYASKDSQVTKTDCFRNDIISSRDQELSKKRRFQTFKSKKKGPEMNLIQSLESARKIVPSSELKNLQKSNPSFRKPSHLQTHFLQNSKSIHKRLTELEMDCIPTSKSVHKVLLGSELHRYPSKAIIGQVNNHGNNSADNSNPLPRLTELEGSFSDISIQNNPNKNSKFLSRIPRPIKTVKRELVPETPNYERDDDSLPLLLKMHSFDADKSHLTDRVIEGGWSLGNNSLIKQKPTETTDSSKVLSILDKRADQINHLRTKYWKKSKLEPLLKVECSINEKSTRPPARVFQTMIQIKSDNKIKLNNPQRIQTAPLEKFDKTRERFRRKSNLRPGSSEKRIVNMPTKVLSVSAIEEIKAKNVKSNEKQNEVINSSVSLQITTEVYCSSNENVKISNEEPNIDSISKF